MFTDRRPQGRASLVAVLAVLAATATPASAVDRIGAWSIDSSQSRIDGAVTILAYTGGIDPAGGNLPNTLALRCLAGDTDLIVATSGLWDFTPAGQYRHVIFRINTAPPVDTRWYSAGSSFVVVPLKTIEFGTVVDFIKMLPSSGQFAIRVYNDKGAPYENAFALDGIDGVREILARACHWPK